MRKKRILLCNEYSGLNSGYATWGQNLLSRLSATNKYELAELGCYCSVEDVQYKKHRWRVYPNSVSQKDQRYSTYKASPNNVYGQWRFDAVCLDFRPDIVVDFRDPWMFEYQSFSPLRPYYKWILMPPVDSAPQKNEWITIFSNADLVVPYTEWAKQVLSQYKHLRLFDRISPAGIDPNIFKPTKLSKSSFGLPEDAFVIGSMMRNQKRKLIPALFEMLSKMDSENILYLHTTYPEMNGWDIPSQLLKYKIFNRVYFTYKCKNCEKHYASNYIGITSKCKYCYKNSLCFVTTSRGINAKELANLYNLFDVYIQYAVCEGFGMPQIEAAACGVPVFSVDYSAMSEVVRTIGGYPIPLANLQCEMESQAQRAYPDINATIELINAYKQLSIKDKEQIKTKTRQNCTTSYNWDNIAQTWEDIFDSTDISTNLNWNNKNQYVFPQNKLNIDTSLNNFDFLYHLCSDLVKSPWLMQTQMIQYMLHSLDHGFVHNGSFMKPYTKKDILQTLEQFAQHKANIDNIRTSQGSITDDYVIYANGTVL